MPSDNIILLEASHYDTCFLKSSITYRVKQVRDPDVIPLSDYITRSETTTTTDLLQNNLKNSNSLQFPVITFSLLL